MKLNDILTETFSDSRLRNFPGGRRDRPVSGKKDGNNSNEWDEKMIRKVKQIIRDEDYAEMKTEYGIEFVYDHAKNHYPGYVAIIDKVLRNEI